MDTFDDFEAEITKNLKIGLDPSRPPLLHHYTNADGLKGIVEDQNLWLTHFRFLNDVREITHGLALFKKALQSNQSGFPPAEQFLRALENHIVHFKPFTFCMCEHSNLLSQWIAYGNKVASFSIGLTSALLTDGYNYQPKLVKVIYNKTRQRKLVGDFVTETYVFTSRHAARLSNPSAQAVFLARVAEAASELLVRFKAPAFKSEREWRLVVPFVRSTGFSTLQYRTSRFGITPFIKLATIYRDGKKPPLPIAQIRIGPSPHYDTTRSGVGAFMVAKGYNIPPLIIRKSGISWR